MGSVPLPGRSGPFRVDPDRPVAIINAENIRAQYRESNDTHYFHPTVAAQIQQVQGNDFIGNQVLAGNLEMHGAGEKLACSRTGRCPNRQTTKRPGVVEGACHLARDPTAKGPRIQDHIPVVGPVQQCSHKQEAGFAVRPEGREPPAWARPHTE